jgi:hypothetical protein
LYDVDEHEKVVTILHVRYKGRRTTGEILLVLSAFGKKRD